MKLYHNPRCSKSRETLKLLQDHGVEPERVLYLDTPPSAAELDTICKALGKEPQEIVRFKEATAKELGIRPSDQRSRKAWLSLLADNPVLMERPIAVAGRRAALGRPPESVLSLLG